MRTHLFSFLTAETECSNTANEYVVENQRVNLECRVMYSGYKMPSMEWSNEYGGLPGDLVIDAENPENIR